jgi:hypothetical protein
MQTSSSPYYCANCHFGCGTLQNWNTHVTRQKHIHNVSTHFFANPTQFDCSECSATFNTQFKLTNHKKTMHLGAIVDSASIIQKLLEQNEALIRQTNENAKQTSENMKKVLDQNEALIKKSAEIPTTTTIVNNHHTTNNNKFNLHIYLNTDCKDAINLTDFMDTIHITAEDAMHVGTVKFVNGIADLVVQRLNALDVTQRPMHCTDVKREIVYIKDKGEWNKDQPGPHSNMNKLVGRVAAKNMKGCNLLKQTYPNYDNPKTGQYAMYNKAKGEALGGDGDRDMKTARIVHKICENITIKKG